MTTQTYAFTQENFLLPFAKSLLSSEVKPEGCERFLLSSNQQVRENLRQEMSSIIEAHQREVETTYSVATQETSLRKVKLMLIHFSTHNTRYFN